MEQSKQWSFEGEQAPKKAKTVKLTGKVMATVFWDARRIIYTDYLVKGKIITEKYYALLKSRKMSSFEKDHFPSKQCTGAHLRSFDGQKYGIKIQIMSTSTVFTRFGPQ